MQDFKKLREGRRKLYRRDGIYKYLPDRFKRIPVDDTETWHEVKGEK